ncbi:hypothetical protein [Tenuibacillus multivorans]|uniref:Tetratricopeptide repeat-containing protein n=1 Tax=Tenuibacillus multivorans TaxID=237069 RepID=A0A1H0DTG9_9BACI|nr:hypothetical protein [Tenuibacillus multivorans]GEL76783.1 hypothetical protein TMU01_10180 [Tenuibacillus multivorans]SDN73494.1 hypothetical protein SAMN05216498_2939 [Tenuibacillus multivorans]
MIQNQFVIHDQKNKPLKLRAERVAFYVRGQIVEAVSEDHELYYLFYYRSEFLTAKKATKIRRGSYIASAFKNGLTFEASHPFIRQLISSNQSSRVINNKQLLRKINKHYTTQEQAYILTFFESFISKKQIFEKIRAMFYEYRRNGQLFDAYQLIRILMDFAPKHSLVKSLSSDLIYKDFTKMYYEKSEELFTNDKIEAEKIMFKNRETYDEQLTMMLEREERWIELMVCLYDQLSHNPSTHQYQTFYQLLQKSCTEHEATQILEYLSNQINFMPLQRDLCDLYLSTNQIEKVSHLISQHPIDLNEKDLKRITEALETVDPNQLTLQLDELSLLLNKVTSNNRDLAERLLHKFIGVMLKDYDLDVIKKWLEPFKKQHGDLVTVEKFKQIYDLNDDLDQMQALGELYYEFKGWNQALECFSLESELKPDEAKPLKWLSKTYREMGMLEESDAYQKLFVNVQKQA